MELCEHIRSIYRNEIKLGNRPLYVSTPKYVDKYADAEIYVIMKNKLQNYNLDGIREYSYTDYRFPHEHYFGCPICRHYISGPMDEHQINWFEHFEFASPHDKVKATEHNVYVEEGIYGKQMIPVWVRESD